LREVRAAWGATAQDGRKQQLRAKTEDGISLAGPRDRDLPDEPSLSLSILMASQQAADATAPSSATAASGEAPPSGASSAAAQNPTAAATAATGATDLEKKMRRAERFGTPVVMSEEEKRSSRAER
jgi:hypothetical protein